MGIGNEIDPRLACHEVHEFVVLQSIISVAHGMKHMPEAGISLCCISRRFENIAGKRATAGIRLGPLLENRVDLHLAQWITRTQGAQHENAIDELSITTRE